MRCISGATIQYASTVSEKQREEKNLKIQRKWNEPESACTSAEGITGQLNFCGHERGIIMIGTCAACGNHEWDKEVIEDIIHCPKCGNSWKFKKLPIFFLTGCSGIGKTTTAQELQKLTGKFIVLDADLFYNIMEPGRDEEYYDMLEQIFNITKNINQAGTPVVWTMAGNIDKLTHTYGTRFFAGIKVLALTAEPDVIRERMTEGRGIKDEGWIQASIEYNEYFRTHDAIGDMKFDKIDCSHGTPQEIAKAVNNWLMENFGNYNPN